MAVSEPEAGKPPEGETASGGEETVVRAMSRPRNILLFSDGTGNSSGKLQKTNVWRLYEALDLGYPVQSDPDAKPDADQKPVQIAFYDDGVGTSSFKLFAILGGVFGFGLARNIREIYKFLCRNYHEGDRIYAFGFSRGAYTIRLLVSLITTMGLVPYGSEADLHRDTLDTWRSYRAGFHTNYMITDFFVALARACWRVLVRVIRLFGRIPDIGKALKAREWRRAGAQFSNLLVWAPAGPVKRSWLGYWWHYWRGPPPPDPTGPSSDTPLIEFVGVWDTVAAYGGPIVEITRGIDALIWPLTMPNYRLSPNVKCARHALCLDDKRDAFTPLPWDEVYEADMVASHAVTQYTGPNGTRDPSPRLQQVWFAGMHSDLGGGYPDDALAYVSLVWMIEHAEAAGARLIAGRRKTIFDFPNVFGPLHNSRGGAGAFYRYQPRYINGWLDYDPPLELGGEGTGEPLRKVHVRPATQIFRDPTVDHARYKTRGILRSPILLHHSVPERLLTATDGYGPNNLPTEYLVDDGIRGTQEPTVPDGSDRPVNPPPIADLYGLGDRIKIRRFWYFLTMLIAFLIAIKPFWPDLPGLRSIALPVDSRTDTQIIVAGLNAVLPSFAATWTNAWGSDPIPTGILLLSLVFTMALGAKQEGRMVDVSRHLWNARFGPAPADPTPRDARVRTGGLILWLARQWRSISPWQRLLAVWKWHVLPIVFGLTMWLALMYAALASLTQVALLREEASPAQCPDRGKPVSHKIGEAITVSIANPCINLGVIVPPSATPVSYHVRIETNGWRDEGHPASPDGWDSNDALSYGSMFFRRVTAAPLFAPVFETRIRGPRRGPWERYMFGDAVYIIRPQLERTAKTVWEGTLPLDFPVDGDDRQLFFFVNDAALPFLPLATFYGNNHGSATITISAPDSKTDLERQIDTRADHRIEARCPRLTDGKTCKAAFAPPPIP